jgi:hypothetical protein
MDPSDSERRKYRKIFEPQEDEILRGLIEQYGAESWSWISSQMPNRTPRQCRERWKTYLCPDVNVAPWTDADDQLLMEKFPEFGTRWSAFRPFFPQRTVNNIKNRWHALTRRVRLDASRRGRSGSSKIPPSATSKSASPEPVQHEAPSPSPLDIYNIRNLLNHDRRLLC